MKFLNIDSPFMQFLGKAADLMWVNILCLLLCLPIFTAGAALTAMHYVCLKIVRDEECYITKAFFKSFKENFVQSTLEWIIMLVMIFIFAGDFYLFYTGAVALPTIIQLITCIFLIVVVLLQSGKKPGLSGAIGGGNNSESYLSRNKSGSMDAKLAKWTKWVGLAFALLTLSLSLIN